MAYKKYNTANNCKCLLSTPINWVSTAIIAKGNYERFPTSNGKILLTSYNWAEEVTGREIIDYTTRVWNTFSVSQRASEKVAITDTATVLTQDPLDFPVDTVIELVTSEGLIKDIQDEVTQVRTDFTNADTDLDNAKLGKGWLRTWLANIWRMFYSNGSNNETELAMSTTGYLKINENSAPTIENPPLDINWQTEVTSITNSTSFIAVTVAGITKKIRGDRYIKTIRTAGYDTTQASFASTFINFTSTTMQVLSTTPWVWEYAICVSDDYIGVSDVTSVTIKKNGTSIIQFLYTDTERQIFWWEWLKDKGFVYHISCNGTDVITVEETRSSTGFNYWTPVHVRYNSIKSID